MLATQMTNVYLRYVLLYHVYGQLSAREACSKIHVKVRWMLHQRLAPAQGNERSRNGDARNFSFPDTTADIRAQPRRGRERRWRRYAD